MEAVAYTEALRPLNWGWCRFGGEICPMIHMNSPGNTYLGSQFGDIPTFLAPSVVLAGDPAGDPALILSAVTLDTPWWRF